MKESEIVKEYTDKLLRIANKVRLLGSDFSDSRIVQKVLVTLPKRYDATISSFKNTKDMSKVILAELQNALQVQEQRRMLRNEVTTAQVIWLVDSGCTNHLTGDKELFRELDKSQVSKVRIGNGEHIDVKGNGVVAIESCTDENDNGVFKFKMRGKSFSLNPVEEEQVACPAIATTTELWHKRLGHFHHAALLNMKEIVGFWIAAHGD
ncbi:hypothetical protein LIER_40722 [Lithospermum erythrorhizon]|uniref:Retrovirus-related Pol polyprotein from transposon TNT 1-94-like beta-barrel domain-containing protein n=1 Tax=Lithospermum erythrorhizon TaxID=34254 RepID=A0AAV3R1C7_LITER